MSLRIIAILFLFSIHSRSNGMNYGKTDTSACDSSLQIPKTFCPNCETWTEDFSPNFTHKIPVEYQINIFDKQGLLVFSSANLDMGWNGKTKNAEGKTTIYYWKISYRYEINGPLYACSGAVALIR